MLFALKTEEEKMRRRCWRMRTSKNHCCGRDLCHQIQLPACQYTIPYTGELAWGQETGVYDLILPESAHWLALFLQDTARSHCPNRSVSRPSCIYRDLRWSRALSCHLPDDPYTPEQLKAPRMNKLVIRPLVDQLYDPDNISVGKKLLAVICPHFGVC